MFINQTHASISKLLATYLLIFGQIYCVSAQSKPKSRGGISKNVEKVVQDSLKKADILLKTTVDSLISLPDSLKTDSIIVSKVIEDTLKLPMAVGDLTETITYQAKDSIIYDLENEMIHLYSGTKIKYDETEVTAPETHFKYVDKTMTANTQTKENGKKEKVILVQDGKEYKGDKMVYNFETQKGKINQLLTTDDGEGFVHGEEVKMNEHGELFGKNAYYTTCENEEHPHFHINVNKVKIIPDKLIVSGPANLVIADVPTPLVLPFAIFPLNIDNNRSTGVIFPSYGQSPGRGFYLQNGGYYWAVNDYLDLAVLGDIYTNGSWETRISSQYRVRYRYNGKFSFSYGRTFMNDRISPEFSTNNNYAIVINHNQDPKARPNGKFGANVNIRSRNYNRNNNTLTQRDLTNTLTSNISYAYNFPRSPFSFSLNVGHTQNLNTGSFTFRLPRGNINMQTIYPFEKKVRVGKKKWYENTTIGYTGNFDNELNTTDLDIFKKETYRDFKTDITHTIPITTQFKLFKHFNLSPSISYTEKWFFKELEYSYKEDSIPPNTEIPGVLEIDTNKNRFVQSREFSNIGPSLSTRLYGIFNFKRGKIKAIRHVLSPTLSYNFLPDFSSPFWNNYKTYTYKASQDIDSTTIVYSRFVDSRTSRQKQSSLRFSLGNTFDMKVRTPKDSINKERKIELLRSLNISSSYNFALDSFNLADISMNASADLFNRFNITFRSSFSPYVYDQSMNRRVDRFLLFEKGKRKLARFQSANLTVRSGFSSDDIKKYFSDKGSGADIREINEYPERFLDFNQKWNVNFSYNLNMSKDNRADSILFTTNTFNMDFSLNLTDKWKVSGGSGYNFNTKEITRTSFDVSRDLHCWQMSFNVVPFGPLSGYNFSIRVKAAVLQDLKLNRVRRWYDL